MSLEGRLWRGGAGLLFFVGAGAVAACAREGGPKSHGDSAEPALVAAPLSASAPVNGLEKKPDELLPANAKTRDQCAEICQKSRQLACKSPDQCLPNCLAMASATPCSEQVGAFYACLVGQPTS